MAVPSNVNDAVLQKLRERKAALTRMAMGAALAGVKTNMPLPFNLPPELLLAQLISDGGGAANAGSEAPSWTYPDYRFSALQGNNTPQAGAATPPTSIQTRAVSPAPTPVATPIPQAQSMPLQQANGGGGFGASVLPVPNTVPVPDVAAPNVDVSFGDRLMKALNDPGIGAVLGNLAQAILPPGTPGHEIGKIGQSMSQARSLAKLVGGSGGAAGAAPFLQGGPGNLTGLEIASLGPDVLMSALKAGSDLQSAESDRVYKAALASGVETPQQMLERQVTLELLGQKPAAPQYDEFKTDIGPGGKQETNARRKHIWLRDRNSGEMLYIHPTTEPEPASSGGSGSGERFKQTSADAGVIDSFLYREFEPKIIAGIRRVNKNADVQEELAQLYDPLKGEVKKDRVMRYLLPEDKKAWATGYSAYTKEYREKGHGADLFSQRLTSSVDAQAIDVGAALKAAGLAVDEKNKAASQKILESNRDKGTNIPLNQNTIDEVWRRMGNK